MVAGSYVQPISRAAIYSALFEKAWAAYPWKNAKPLARRVRLFSEVPPSNRPAFYQFEGGNETFTYPHMPMANRVLEAKWIVYTSCSSPDAIGSDIIMTVLDALEACLVPSIQDQLGLGGQKQTLGGLVSSCRIEGTVFKDPGDLDNDGLLTIPIRMIVP